MDKNIKFKDLSFDEKRHHYNQRAALMEEIETDERLTTIFFEPPAIHTLEDHNGTYNKVFNRLKSNKIILAELVKKEFE